MNDVNIPLLRKAVEWAEAEAVKPEIDRTWIQGTWITRSWTAAYDMLEEVSNIEDHQLKAVAEHCGTAYCVAGYIGQLLDERYAIVSEVDGVHVSEFVEQALGLDECDAEALFAGGNSIEDIRILAERFAGERL